MCCFSKEELEQLKAMAQERKKLKEALDKIKPSDFEKKEKEEERKTVVTK
ncbi:MAG: hypothetical protein RMK75_00630 [Aquificaceae bacterium]|nr:hypothetical protein [Aquificaceae bacterium]MCS7277421.1 hypothetical protein [Aquificaceae bacterium]MDW8066462.1 hypothetical protein [Aquificaceae bacterium]MDW8422818.1 hypothetical protein [Aquificaceae bacterium]